MTKSYIPLPFHNFQPKLDCSLSIKRTRHESPAPQRRLSVMHMAESRGTKMLSKVPIKPQSGPRNVYYERGGGGGVTGVEEQVFLEHPSMVDIWWPVGTICRDYAVSRDFTVSFDSFILPCI